MAEGDAMSKFLPHEFFCYFIVVFGGLQVCFVDFEVKLFSLLQWGGNVMSNLDSFVKMVGV